MMRRCSSLVPPPITSKLGLPDNNARQENPSRSRCLHNAHSLQRDFGSLGRKLAMPASISQRSRRSFFGSDRQMPPRGSPFARRGRKRCFCSPVPNRTSTSHRLDKRVRILVAVLEFCGDRNNVTLDKIPNRLRDHSLMFAEFNHGHLLVPLVAAGLTACIHHSLRVAGLRRAQAAAQELFNRLRSPAGESFDISRYQIEGSGLQSLLESGDCIDHSRRQTNAREAGL